MKTPGTTRPVYDWLQKQSEIDAIVELPYPDQYYDLQYMHHSLTHGKRLLNGFSGYYPKDYPKGRELLTRFPSVESLAFLRAKKIGWVVLHQEAYPAAEWAALQARIAQHMGEITLMYSGGGSHVLKLVPQVGR